MFKEIIFPPLPRPEVTVTKYVPTAHPIIKSWIINTIEEQVLFVKCPTCGFCFQYEKGMYSELIQEALTEHADFFMKKIEEVCPRKKDHYSMDYWE